MNIQKNSNTENYSVFLKKISNLSDFDSDPFINFIKIIRSKWIMDLSLKIYIDEFSNFLEYLISLREKKRERTMSTEEWEETNKEGTCIICYAAQSDMVMRPCGHGNKLIY